MEKQKQKIYFAAMMALLLNASVAQYAPEGAGLLTEEPMEEVAGGETEGLAENVGLASEEAQSNLTGLLQKKEELNNLKNEIEAKEKEYKDNKKYFQFIRSESPEQKARKEELDALKAHKQALDHEIGDNATYQNKLKELKNTVDLQQEKLDLITKKRAEIEGKFGETSDHHAQLMHHKEELQKKQAERDRHAKTIEEHKKKIETLHTMKEKEKIETPAVAPRQALDARDTASQPRGMEIRNKRSRTTSRNRKSREQVNTKSGTRRERSAYRKDRKNASTSANRRSRTISPRSIAL